MEPSTADPTSGSGVPVCAPTSSRPLPRPSFRTLPTPPIVPLSNEKHVGLAHQSKDLSTVVADSSTKPTLPSHKDKRIESLPPDYYAPHHCSHSPQSTQQLNDRSPPPDYYAPHSATNISAPQVSSTAVNNVQDTVNGGHPSTDTEIPTCSTPDDALGAGVGAKTSLEASDTLSAIPSTFAPVRRQAEASSCWTDNQPYVDSPKTSKRSSFIFRAFGQSSSTSTTSSSSAVLHEGSKADTSSSSSSRSPTPGSSSHHARPYSPLRPQSPTRQEKEHKSPTNVANILSQLNPPTATLQNHKGSTAFQSRQAHPFTSPYAKHSKSSSVSYMLSALDPSRATSRTSTEGHSTNNTESSFSLASAGSSQSGGRSSDSAKRKSKEPDRSQAADLSVPRPTSPENVAALVSSLFAPLPPLAPLVNPAEKVSSDAVTGPSPSSSQTGLLVGGPSHTSTERVVAVSSLLDGLAPAPPDAPDGSLHTSKLRTPQSDSLPRSDRTKHHGKQSSQQSWTSSTGKISSLASLIPSSLSLMRPSMDVKPRPLELPSSAYNPSVSPAASSHPLAPHEVHQKGSSKPGRSRTTDVSSKRRNQGPKNDTMKPSTQGWTNPLLALDSKIKPPLQPTANIYSHTEPSTGRKSPPPFVKSHLASLRPSSPSLNDVVSKDMQNSSNTASKVQKKGASMAKLGAMFGSSKG